MFISLILLFEIGRSFDEFQNNHKLTWNGELAILNTFGMSQLRIWIVSSRLLLQGYHTLILLGWPVVSEFLGHLCQRYRICQRFSDRVPERSKAAILLVNSTNHQIPNFQHTQSYMSGAICLILHQLYKVFWIQ